MAGPQLGGVRRQADSGDPGPGRQEGAAVLFRTSDGYELALLLDWGTDRWAVEVKLTSDPSTDMIARLHKTADLVDASLICRIPGPIENPKLLVTDLAGWLRRLLA